uniref:Solute carrier family 22 member 11-like n=1 Tax=Monodelphis domestica TaxID=13616 RepID=F7EK28_MONDO
MAFEDLLAEAEAKGRFRALQILTLAVPLVLIGGHFLLENLTAFVPKHRCWVHELDNTSASLSISEDLNLTSLLKVFIPLDSDGRPESCRRFSAPQWQALLPNVTTQNFSQLEMEPCADGWVYDQSIITSSIVTEWDLVCDSQTLKTLSQSIFFAGILVGHVLWGCLSDRFGRKWILLLNYFLLAVFSTGAAFAQSFSIYCSFHSLLGISLAGIVTGSGSIGFEWSSSHYRDLITVIFSMSASLGHVLLGIVAYNINQWRQLQLVMSVPFFVFSLTAWWLPESARWLIVHNKLDDALKEFRKVAKINGVKDYSLTIEALRSTMEKESDAAQTHYTVLDAVHFPILRTRVLCLSISGFSFLLIFYGMALDIQNLGQNIQRLQIVFGVSTLVSKLVALFFMNCFGRQRVIVASLFPAVLLIFGYGFLSQEILRTVLAMLGISCIVICMCNYYVYSFELLPTIVRNTCRGLIFTVERIGTLLAPLINLLMIYSPVLPKVIFATLAITTCLLTFFFLPETKNQPVPDTIQEMECGHSRKEASPRNQGDTKVKISQF